MRKSLTLNLLLILAISFGAYTVSAQTLIWGGAGDPVAEFNGGLTGWTATGLSSSDPTKADLALWEWKANGKADGGAYWGTLPAIASASVANGAAVFNSDRLDNAGIVGNFGLGDCPSPHKGVLTSPVIDCSAFATVAVNFTQYYRNFQSTTSIEVTVDNGATWVPFALNGEIATNAATPNNSQKVVNISAVAANQSAVQFRFAFDGEYYFWIVDDVSLTTLPDNDLVMSGMYYSPSSFQTPQYHAKPETWFFAVNVSSPGGAAQTNVWIKATITNTATSEILYTDSMKFDEVAQGLVDSLFDLTDMSYDVPDILTIGQYRLTYTMWSEDHPDITPTDNTLNELFNFSEKVFSKDQAITGGLRPGADGDYAFGNYYKMSPDDNIQTTALSTTFSCTAGAPEVLNGRSVNVYLLEVNCLDDFSDFEGLNYYGTTPGDELVLVGLNNYTFTAADANYAEFTVDILDFETGETGVVLKPNGKYFIVTEYAGALNYVVYMGVSNSIDYTYKPDAVSPVWISGDRWYTQGFGADDAIAVQRLNTDITFTTGAEETLPVDALSVFPNPVKGEMNVTLDLGKAAKGNLSIADITGKVLKTVALQNGGQQNTKIDVSGFAQGSYFLRLTTSEGIRTVKVMITE